MIVAFLPDIDAGKGRTILGFVEAVRDRSRGTRGCGESIVSKRTSSCPFSLAKTCGGERLSSLRSTANVTESAEWFARARQTLNLTGEQMASLLGCGVRTWWAYENGETLAPHVAYLVVRRLLDEQGLSSSGAIRIPERRVG